MSWFNHQTCQAVFNGCVLLEIMEIMFQQYPAQVILPELDTSSQTTLALTKTLQQVYIKSRATSRIEATGLACTFTKLCSSSTAAWAEAAAAAAQAAQAY